MHEGTSPPLSPKPLSVFLLVSGYLAGAVVIPFDLIPDFIYLTPFHLTLSFALLLWNHPGGPDRPQGFILYVLVAFLLGSC